MIVCVILAKDELVEVDKNQLADFQKRLSQTSEEFTNAKKQCDEDLEAANYQLAKQKDAKKKENEKLRYAREKVQKQLVGGGWPKGFASDFAEFLQTRTELQSLRNKDEMQWNQLTLFRADPVPDDNAENINNSIYRAVQAFQASCKSKLPSKVKSCVAFLTEHPKKPTAVSNVTKEVTTTLTSTSVGVDRFDFNDMPGHTPWVAACRTYQKPDPSDCFPLQGIGCMLQNLTETPTSFFLVPIKVLVDSGLTVLADFHSFLCQKSGQERLKGNIQCITLSEPKEILFVPFGYLTLPFAHPVPGDEKSKTSAFWHFPVLHKAAYQAMDPKVWMPVVKLNRDYLQPMIGQQIWKQRFELWEKIQSAEAWNSLNPDVSAEGRADTLT